MHQRRRFLLGLFIACVGWLAMESSAEAWGYRAQRGYNAYRNQMAAVQRANAAMAAAQARVFAAQTNLNRVVRQTRNKALSSSPVVSSKSDHTGTLHDYQTARSKVIASLKQNNSEFSGLLRDCQALRQKVIALNNSGDASGLATIESELRLKARKVGQIEDEAINADPSVKAVLARQASSHSTEVAATKDALNSVSQDPAVQAALKQLNQAQIQAQLAANRYNGTGNTMPYVGRRSYRRGRVGYVNYGTTGVMGVLSGPYRTGARVQTVHVHAVHVHSSVRRRR